MNYDPNTGEPIVNNNNNSQPVQNGTNGFAIAGLIVSIFVSAIIGLILSIIGLSQSKKVNSGKGLAIAGIIISILKLLLEIIVVLLCGAMFAGIIHEVTDSNAVYCSLAYECGEPDSSGYASCKYKDSDNKEVTISCPVKNTTTKKVTTTTASKGEDQVLVVTDDFQKESYYADKFYVKNYELYARPTKLGKSSYYQTTTINGDEVYNIIHNVKKAYLVEEGQAGMQKLIIVDKLDDAYRVIISENEEERAFKLIEIKNAKNIKDVYSLVGGNAVNIVFVNKNNQIVPTYSDAIEIDNKNKIYESLVGTDVYKAEFVKEEQKDNSYVAYYNIYINGKKLDEQATVTDMESLKDSDLVFIAKCSNNKFGDACN